MTGMTLHDMGAVIFGIERQWGRIFLHNGGIFQLHAHRMSKSAYRLLGGYPLVIMAGEAELGW